MSASLLAAIRPRSKISLGPGKPVMAVSAMRVTVAAPSCTVALPAIIRKPSGNVSTTRTPGTAKALVLRTRMRYWTESPISTWVLSAAFCSSSSAATFGSSGRWL